MHKCGILSCAEEGKMVMILCSHVVAGTGNSCSNSVAKEQIRKALNTFQLHEYAN